MGMDMYASKVAATIVKMVSEPSDGSPFSAHWFVLYTQAYHRINLWVPSTDEVHENAFEPVDTITTPKN
eukprot:5068385-Amphidinium_carterae.1